MENNKPISEWTLDEAQAECDAHNDDCTGCKLLGVTCELKAIRAPYNWGLEGKRDEVAATDTDASHTPARPRLAEILGVEVGERFTFRDGEKEVPGLFIRKDGCLYDSTYQTAYAALVCACVNHPESIIRIPRLTEAELAICKVLGAKWVSRDEDENPWVELWNKEPDVEVDGDNMRYFCSESGACVLALVNKNIFKSIHPGDCICVGEAQK